jgi:hypothetical protein
LYPWGDSGIGEAVDKRKGRLIKAGYLFRRSDNSTKKPLFDENSLKTPLSDNFSPLGKAWWFPLKTKIFNFHEIQKKSSFSNNSAGENIGG